MKFQQTPWRFGVTPLIILISSGVVKAAPDDIEAVPQKAVVQNQFVMDDANFEANVFQPHGNAKQARSVLETRLRLQINEINRICKLDAGQEAKLKLAGGVDIKRFFDEVDVVRKKFQSSKKDQQAWNEVWQEISPMQTKLSSGLFGETSFFQKTMHKTLTDEQRQGYDKVVMERRKFRYRAMIESVLTNMETSVPLRHNQHEWLANLIFTETDPPSVFGQYDQYLVMYHMANIPEDKLKSQVDERQWSLLQAQMNNYRGMEQFLIQNGLIPKQEAEVKILKAKVKRQVVQVESPADGNPAEKQNEDKSK